ncbi:MAG: chemotaxis protein CheW [Syntrophothermaceae bacterium]|jgi:purine-binding chemotaxis protein CheW
MSAENLLSSDEMQLVTFRLDQENFGINIMNVQEIIRIPSITTIPQAPAYVEGVTNLRGTILPVINTRTKFGMPAIERDVASRVIVVDINGKTIGLSVDAVSEVLRVENENIEPAPAMVAESDTNTIAGMVKVNEGSKVVMILDVSQLCSIDKSNEVETAVTTTGKTLEQTEEKILEEVQLVSFLLGDEEFALEIESVREIIRFPEIVKVPNVPDYIKGVISLRDRLLPVIDMRIKLDMGSDEVNDHTRVVVIDIGNIQLGMVVDKVHEVTRVARDTIFPPPQTIVGQARQQLQGIVRLDEGERIIMLLEASSIMTGDEMVNIEQLETTESAAVEEEVDQVDTADEEQMVVFKLADEQYGVRITQVQEINRLSRITRVPRAPRFVEGVVNLRGDVIPVIDLRQRFEMEAQEYTEFTRIIVSDIHNKKIGIIVDEVLEVLRVSQNQLETAPEVLQDDQIARFMEGIANLPERMILMLNLENILIEKEWKKLIDMDKPEPAKKSKKKPAKLKKQGRSE